MTPDETSFRTRFCVYYRCSEDQYEQEALKRFLYPPWSAFAWLLIRFFPRAVETDLQIVRQLGLVASGGNFAAEVRDIRGDYGRRKDFGFVRSVLRLRLSRERIFNSAKPLWQKKTGESASATGTLKTIQVI